MDYIKLQVRLWCCTSGSSFAESTVDEEGMRVPEEDIYGGSAVELTEVKARFPARSANPRAFLKLARPQPQGLCSSSSDCSERQVSALASVKTPLIKLKWNNTN